MTATESIVIDGYDLLAEKTRELFLDRTLCGRTINRSTAVLSASGTPHPDYAEVKSEHRAAIMPNTIEASSPAIDLSYPASGMFVDSPAGIYLDLYQAVAQKVVDEQHPSYQECIGTLAAHGLAFRREINTDDYVFFGLDTFGLHTPQDLARLVNRLTVERLPEMGSCQTFFSNSGAEAGEAGIKLAQLHAYHRFVEAHGHQELERLMADLCIPRDEFYDDDSSLPDPLFADYPFFIIGCDKAFHGRTLGVLNLTRSKKSQHLGYSKFRWVKHVAFNGSLAEVEELFDDRPITEILDAPGGVRAVIADGKVPADLFAGFVVEAYQGEGGYTIADREWLTGMAAACRSRGALLCVDEVQSFGRTGRLYAVEHMGVTPDIVWVAKAAVLGITIARQELAADLHSGWHSNTFGSGKLFDVNMSWVTFHLLTAHREEAFEGRTLLENSRIKGEYVRMCLAELSAAHPELFPEFSGLGCMWGLSVEHREDVIETGWRMGLKLLGCGDPGEVSRIRILLLADVLTHEIDQMIEGLDRVFSIVEKKHSLGVDPGSG